MQAQTRPEAQHIEARPVHQSDTAESVIPADDTVSLLSPRAPVHAAGLYLHVPFCFHKCHYCDFYSIVDDHDRQRAFTDRLIAELRAVGPLLSRDETRGIQTIFVGGGTPTLLKPEHWARLLGALRDAVDLSHLREFTVEANPETLTADLLGVLVAGGVNRISIGAQSFKPRHLKTLERWHDPRNVVRSVELCHAAGVGNVNLDLIFAIPGQNVAEWESDLDTALSLGPTHLSCYSLMFEPNTALTKKLRLGLVQRSPEEVEAAMFRATVHRLTDAGFEHYEVSNFAQFRTRNAERGTAEAGPASGSTVPSSEFRVPRSFRCRHNLLYWLNENWIALGPSGSGHVAGLRWKNRPHLGQYLASTGGSPVQDVERLDPDASAGEQIMLRLRLLEGAPLDWLEPRLTPARRDAIDSLLATGLLERAAGHLRLTPAGLMVADSVFAELL